MNYDILIDNDINIYNIAIYRREEIISLSLSFILDFKMNDDILIAIYRREDTISKWMMTF